MKEQHLTLQKNTKTLQAWSISVTAKLYIHLPGILMLNESKPTLKNSRRTLRQNFSSGTYSMVCFCFLSLRNLHSFDFTFFLPSSQVKSERCLNKKQITRTIWILSSMINQMSQFLGYTILVRGDTVLRQMHCCAMLKLRTTLKENMYA